MITPNRFSFTATPNRFHDFAPRRALIHFLLFWLRLTKRVAVDIFLSPHGLEVVLQIRAPFESPLFGVWCYLSRVSPRRDERANSAGTS